MKHLWFAKGLCAAVGAGALWLGAATGAFAVDVKGSVKAAPGAPKGVAPLRESYWREWNGFLQPVEAKMDLAREVVAVLIGAKGSNDAVTVAFKGGDLFPRTIVVQAGADLRLRNTDDTSHELYAEGLKEFGPDETRAGLGRQVSLDKAGSWPLHDRLASHVTGHLHVLDKVSAVAQPARNGSFTFPSVPGGKYMLKIFRGADEVSAKPIEVPDGGKAITVDPILVTPRTN